MNNFDNFVGVYENAYSQDFCKEVIEYFETSQLAGRSFTRQEDNSGVLKMQKDDTTVLGDLGHALRLIRPFNTTFWECYAQYSNKYDVLKTSETHSNFVFKVQKTEIGQGYHVWHYESGTRPYSNRLLAWTLYLNDVEEGGETEFLYCPKRIKPKTGTLVIWPAGFTHAHRGNPPLSNTKYIVTGWVEF